VEAFFREEGAAGSAALRTIFKLKASENKTSNAGFVRLVFEECFAFDYRMQMVYGSKL
jgi:hypothetical protein